MDYLNVLLLSFDFEISCCMKLVMLSKLRFDRMQNHNMWQMVSSFSISVLELSSRKCETGDLHCMFLIQSASCFTVHHLFICFRKWPLFFSS